ncbi:hypothetical protein K7X08_001713 [Anisodus acutangulus]|uniref:Uncharacterized protein n=1 Tax=Anisodus acutangulus TaxID=402998 RepID=A0A9Q1LRK1_9SOLA|nr:hypothetical protein K7X08_001713 [Anisodus acutangulus]
MVSSTNPLGPDPKDLPKDVSMVLSMSSTGQKEHSVDVLSSRYVRNSKKDDANRKQLSLLSTKNFKGSVEMDQPKDVSIVLSISPMGEKESLVGALNSRLPFPTFSLRPKLSCNAEASIGVDAGATDDLRRLLRLR